MHVIVIESNTGGQFAVDLGEQELDKGTAVKYPSGGLMKYADVMTTYTDPVSKRTVAIAFYRGGIVKGQAGA